MTLQALDWQQFKEEAVKLVAYLESLEPVLGRDAPLPHWCAPMEAGC